METIRVLHCINGMGSGGAETDIINWESKLKSQHIYFDFLIRSNDIFYKKQIENNDGHIYIVTSFYKNMIKNIYETYIFFKKNGNKYKVVHVHGNTAFYIIPLIFAKIYHIPIRIFHIHSTQSANKLSLFLHSLNSRILKFLVTNNIACSSLAAKFGNMKNPIIIKNMIDLNKFCSIDFKKNELKDKYGISKYKNVFVHIGRFLDVKNHKFVLRVFKEILLQDSNSCLLLVGIGPLFNEIKDMAKKLKIYDKVFFLGEILEVNEILHISNLMIFPSLYEGIPLTLLEAQAAGLKVLASSNIDKEAKITPYLEFLDLKKGEKFWAKESLATINKNIDCNIKKCFIQANYDLDENINKLQMIYNNKI